MTIPTLTHDARDMNRVFGSAVVGRGRVYAEQGMVTDVAWSADGMTLTGSCEGSGGARYRQTIRFSGPPSAATIQLAHCSCPVTLLCKHCAALLYHAEWIGRPVQPGLPVDATVHASAPPVVATPAARPATSWRASIADVVAGPTQTGPQGKRLALAIGLTRPSTRFAHLHSRHVLLRPMIEGARQPWIKTGATWTDILWDGRIAAPRAHVTALQSIFREVTKRGYGAAVDWLDLTPASSSVWRLIDDAVAAGVALIPAPDQPLTSVTLGKAQLNYGLAPHPDGACMTRTVTVDDRTVQPTDELAFIGTPVPHGLWMLNGGDLVIAGFAAEHTAAELDAARTGSDIIIPAADLDEFATDVLPRLQQVRCTTVAEGLFVPPTIEGPEVVLTVADGPSGARCTWSIGYRVNEKNVLFNPAAEPGATPYRDSGAESALWQELRDVMRDVAGSSAAATSSLITDSSLPQLQRAVELTTLEAAVLCGELLPTLTERPGLRVNYRLGQRFSRSPHTPTIAFGADEDTGSGDWFGLDVAITLGNQRVPTADVIREIVSGATHMMLPNDEYFALDVPELATLAELLDEARSLGEIDSGRFSRHSLNATFWEELLELGVVDRQLAQWRKRMAQLASAKPPTPVKPSRRLNAELRDYQNQGLNWLAFLYKNDLGGILADDMGLGKTVQTLALVARAADATRTCRFLVIAPTSVVPNWVAESRKFVPGLSVSSITSTPSRSGVPVSESVGGANIVVTSYSLLRLLFDDLDEFEWDGIIFDEAQFIKNHTGKTHQCARRLTSSFKLAITGTPMENNLMELWSLLSVTAPGLFPSPSAFTDYFRKPIESNSAPERLDTLRRRMKPVMLRRTKSQVAIDLPPKQEQAMVLELGAKHRKIYDTRLARERQKVLGLLGDWEKNRFQIFRSLTLLRQLSLHAALVDSTHNSIDSAKIDYLLEQLPTLIDEGHSALVFSQFTGFLDIVRTHLDGMGITYSYLDGTMTAPQRDAAVRRFTSGATQVFLISLKAGGFGLNLTEADYCFVCDPWWNPAAEAQAIDRAHRIGQERPVSVYRLVSADTIEERVVRLQDRKRALFDAVVDDGELFGTTLSANDIRDMLG